MKITLAAALTLLPMAVLAAAPADPAGSGHWEGTIQISNKSVKVTVDLARSQTGEWVGALGLPEQNLTRVAVSNISVKDGSVSFESREWLFAVEGKISPDGKSIEGDFVSAFLLHVPVPVRLERVLEAIIQEPCGSTPLSKNLEGTWEGVLTLGASWEKDDQRAGSTVTVRVTLANVPGGAATGTLKKSGTTEPNLPITGIQQSQNSLRFEVRGAGATYVAELKDRELVGEWRQFDLDPVPLTLRHIDGM